MNKLANIAQLITTDFMAFCSICLTIPAKDFTVPPEETTVRSVPFSLAQHQIEFLNYLKTPMTDKIVLKCRQRGYSVLLLAYCLWLILYSRDQNLLYIIDREDKAKEFRRLLQELFHSIPEVFKPKGIAIMASNEIYNHNRNNHLSLRTASSSVGRSGTYTLAIVDEYAYYDLNIQEDIAASLTSSCQNRIWISTPKQENDNYHHKVNMADKQGLLWKHTYWEWIDDWFGGEDNAKLWRKEQEKDLKPAQIARELDCKFKGAAEDLIWLVPPEASRIFNKNTLNSRVIVSLDVGWEDDTAVLFAYDYGGCLHIIDEIVTNHTATPHLASLMKGRYAYYKYGVIDSAALKVDQTSSISIHNDMSRRLGCRFYTGKPRQEEGIQIAQTALLEGRIFIDSNKCPLLIEMFNNYEREGEVLPRSRYKHLHDSFVYLCYNWLKKSSKKITPPRLLNRRSVGIL